MKTTVGIIGAGPAGLAMARACKNAGLSFIVMEKHKDVGGIWDKENPGSPMYHSAHFISSKKMSGFAGYPMPDEYPDYPSSKLILEYIRTFAKKEGIYEFIHFNEMVQTARFENGVWIVESENQTYQFTYLVCANGSTWDPILPNWLEEFKGEVIHSKDYKFIDALKNKRVLIVGGGNSGVDIACDAAKFSQFAAISLRRPYYFFPKHITGIPTDEYGDKYKWIPKWIRFKFFKKLIESQIGTLDRYGLPIPEYKLLESHPIMNTQILHHIKHGDLSYRPDIQEIQNKTVIFKNQKKEEFDLIIAATGYHMTIPYLNYPELRFTNRRPEFLAGIFCENQPQLFGISFIETNGGIFSLFDLIGETISAFIKVDIKDRQYSNYFLNRLEKKLPDFSGGLNRVKSARSTNYFDKETFKNFLLETRLSLLKV